MEPVSTKQGTGMPLIVTTRCGHDDISCDTELQLPNISEPEFSPTEQWPNSSVGISFPAMNLNEAVYAQAPECLYEVAWERKKKHAPHHTLQQNGQIFGTFYI